MAIKRASLASLILTVAVSAACGSAGGDPQLAGATQPSAEPFPPKLQKKLAAALTARGPDYVPRTHHLHEDGSPEFTNRLILESSPYLVQHAHNPVNWYPWGDEAFETAKRLGRPVLLSIGYSTCHWCHVMERESFEDEEIAAYMNANYIAIKVDREERPDLDAIYMAAVNELAGQGGWPMTTWLTPDRKPFYGGTYFPPRDGGRRNRRGFLPLLAELKQLYDESPEQVADDAERVSRVIQGKLTPPAGRDFPRPTVFPSVLSHYREKFDRVNGGTGRAPKFPSNMPIRLLLRYYLRSGKEVWREMATLTLDKMARGGIHDQVGGGFHRYTVDAKWLIPHFEKMLYDNAQLTVAFLEGYQVTGREDFAKVARDILAYVGREMTSPEGGFYSATDADSPTPTGEREEGWFFTWPLAQIRDVLGPDDARPILAYYGVTANGNFKQRNILNGPRPLAEVAADLELSPAELGERIESARKKLYEVRLKRPAPLRDEKILTAWNGLMISAMAQGGFILREPDFIDRAERAARFVLTRSRKEGRLLRSFKDSQARHKAYLQDYAFLIAGLLDLYEATSGLDWLREAIELQAVLDRHYLDERTGGYFLTSDDHEQLLARQRPSRDRAVPSGNSVAAMNLLRLHELTTEDRYGAAAERLFTTFSRNIGVSPQMLVALDFHMGAAKEVIIVTPKTREQAEPFLAELRRTYLPNRVLVVASEGRDLEAQAELIPLVEGKVARRGKPTAYVCEQGLCKLPTTRVDVFARLLAQSVTPAPGDGAAH